MGMEGPAERGPRLPGTVWLPDWLYADGAMRAGWAVAVAGGQLAAVGPAPEVLAAHAGWRLERLGDRLLLPGSINGHSHSFQILMRGMGEDDDFFGWRSGVLYPVSQRLSREEIGLAAELAYADMLRHGVTTVADFFYLNDQGIENALVVAAAARRVGMRLVLARTFYDWEGAPARYRETPAQARQHTLELAAALRGDPLVTVQVAPHSPHGASAAMFAAAVATAEELDTPLHVHVAEGAYEREQVLAAHGVSPVAWLDQVGALGSRSVLIHAVWTDEADWELIRERGAAVIHNPASNMILGDGIAPLPALLARGIRVGLGTDGGCTNDRSSVLDEMRMAALLQKVQARNGQALDAVTAFRLGTEAGADALGLSTGRLVPGCAADAFTVNLRDLSLLPGPPTIRHVVYALSATAVDTVWVAGRSVVEHGRPVHLDPARVAWASGWQRERGY